MVSFYKKRGLSAAVGILLLILLTIVVAVVIWNFVHAYIDAGINQSESCSLENLDKVQFKNKFTCFQENYRRVYYTDDPLVALENVYESKLSDYLSSSGLPEYDGGSLDVNLSKYNLQIYCIDEDIGGNIVNNPKIPFIIDHTRDVENGEFFLDDGVFGGYDFNYKKCVYSCDPEGNSPCQTTNDYITSTGDTTTYVCNDKTGVNPDTKDPLIPPQYACASKKGVMIFSVDIGDVNVDEVLVTMGGGGVTKTFTIKNGETPSVNGLEGPVLLELDYCKDLALNKLDVLVGGYENLKLVKKEGHTYVTGSVYLPVADQKPDYLELSPVINGKKCGVSDRIDMVPTCLDNDFPNEFESASDYCNEKFQMTNGLFCGDQRCDDSIGERNPNTYCERDCDSQWEL